MGFTHLGRVALILIAVLTAGFLGKGAWAGPGRSCLPNILGEVTETPSSWREHNVWANYGRFVVEEYNEVDTYAVRYKHDGKHVTLIGKIQIFEMGPGIDDRLMMLKDAGGNLHVLDTSNMRRSRRLDSEEDQDLLRSARRFARKGSPTELNMESARRRICNAKEAYDGNPLIQRLSDLVDKGYKLENQRKFLAASGCAKRKEFG